MIPLAVSELAAGLALTRGDGGRMVERVTTDSREAGPGALFCALEGTRVDGHAFLADAIAAGAAAVLCRRGSAPASGDVAVLEVDDPLTALGVLARRTKIPLRCIAVPQAVRVPRTKCRISEITANTSSK